MSSLEPLDGHLEARIFFPLPPAGTPHGSDSDEETPTPTTPRTPRPTGPFDLAEYFYPGDKSKLDLEQRSDTYLDLGDPSIGIKFRGADRRVEVKMSTGHEGGIHEWKKKTYGSMSDDLTDHAALIQLLQAGLEKRLLVLPPSSPDVTNRALEVMQELPEFADRLVRVEKTRYTIWLQISEFCKENHVAVGRKETALLRRAGSVVIEQADVCCFDHNDNDLGTYRSISVEGKGLAATLALFLKRTILREFAEKQIDYLMDGYPGFIQRVRNGTMLKHSV